MQPRLFDLTSDQCEILTTFEAAGSLAELARAVGRDVSVVSRQLQALARSRPVVEKYGGRWRVTPLGARVAQWARDAATSQARLLARPTDLRVVTTREFAARVLAPRLAELLAEERPALVQLVTSEGGVERALLEGRADVGLDCGRPRDPLVRFRGVVAEPFAAVAAPGFLRRHRVRGAEALLGLPHLEYTRATAAALLGLDRQVPALFASFNDIASAREAAVAGLGWALLPAYTVAREVSAGALLSVPGWSVRPERFGVFWLSTRGAVGPWVRRAIAWLAEQDLSLPLVSRTVARGSRTRATASASSTAVRSARAPGRPTSHPHAER